MSALDLKLIDLAHRALEPITPAPRNLRIYPSVPEADEPKPYRGPDWKAGSGDEFLRLAELRNAGQGDLFGGER